MIENKKYIIFDLKNTKVDSLLLADLKAYGYKLTHMSESDFEEAMTKEEELHETLNIVFHYKGHRKAQVVIVTDKAETVLAAKVMEIDAIGFGENAVDENVEAEFASRSQEELRALLINEAELQAIRAGEAMPKDGPTATFVKGKTNKEPGKKRVNAMAVAWKFLYPFLLFYFAGGILEGFCNIMLNVLVSNSELMREALVVVDGTEKYFNEIAYVIMQFFKYIGGFLVAYFFLKGNKSIQETHKEPKGFTTLNYISWTVLSVVFAVGMNCLFAGLGILESDATYVESANELYGVGIILGLVLYGVVVPIAEEVMFRGVIFSGLKKDLKPFSAAAISAALFGAYHGNIIQAVYGFALGIMIAYAYNYSKRILAPIIIHSVVNIVVFLCTNLDIFQKGGTQTTIGTVCTAMGILVLLYIVKTKELNIVQENM